MIRTFCVATVISRLGTCDLLFVALYRTRRRFGLPRRLRLRAKTFLLFYFLKYVSHLPVPVLAFNFGLVS